MSSKLKRYGLTARGQKYAFQGLELPYFVFELRKPVQPELLCIAARRAVKLHPLFGTTMKTDGLYFLEEDPEWEQHPEGTVIAGGAGNPLWKIMCTENRVLLTGSHALSDGMGFMQFAATLFHLYFELCGVRFSEAAGCDIPEDPEKTTTHPADLCPGPQEYSLGFPKFPPPALLPEAAFSIKEPESLHMIEFAEDEIRRFASQSETSVFSVIACLLARTAENAFQMTEGSIIVRVPVDFRKSFSTYTDYNFSQGFSLCYRPEKMAHMSDSLVETAFRSQLDIYTDKDNMVYSLQKDLQRLERMKEDRTGFISFRKQAEDAGEPRAIIRYSHLTRPSFSEELSREFTRLFMVSDSEVAPSMLVGAISLNGKITMTVNQHVTGHRFTDALKNSLDKKGIDYTIREIRLRDILPAASPDNFKKE